MTETREVTKDVYREIVTAIYAVLDLIRPRMDKVRDANPALTGEWQDLHGLTQILSGAAAVTWTLHRAAPDPDEHVEVLPAGHAPIGDGS